MDVIVIVVSVNLVEPKLFCFLEVRF